MNKNGFGSVVATALLIVVSVFAVIGYQTWFQTYSSQILVDVENKSLLNTQINIETLINDKLYLSSNNDFELESFKITGKNNSIFCNINRPSNENLLAYWSFSNYDSTYVFDNYNENELKFYNFNSSYIYSNGVFGNYIDFSENRSFSLTKYGNPSYDMGYENMTIALWYKSTNINSNNYLIMAGAGGGFDGYRFEIRDDSKLAAIIGNESDYELVKSTFEVAFDNQWHFVAVTFNRTGSIKFYYDNISEVSEDISEFKDSYINLNTHWIGLTTMNSNAAFLGQLDEVIIYKRILSPKEIEYLRYNSLQNLKGISSVDISLCNLDKDNTYEFLLSSNSGVYSKEFYYD